jgi:hypothetical protein
MNLDKLASASRAPLNLDVRLQSMAEDPHIKRVLKRYRRDSAFPDASLDVTRLGVDVLLRACAVADSMQLNAPRELKATGLLYLSSHMGVELDRDNFDYYIHSYVRAEFSARIYEDPSFYPAVPSELGPPSKIPVPDGCRWVSVRPKNGEETYEAWETGDALGQA